MLGQNAPALLISTVVHVALLGAMAFYKISMSLEQPVIAVETVIDDERAQQEFEQDLSLDTTVSENLSAQAGGMVTTAIGSAAATPVAQAKIEKSEALADPDIKVTSISDISLPGLGELSMDLGEGEVSGEVGARVEGYGAAMARMTQELTRMMRRQPVIVVWLFDASNSLEDDRKELRDNFEKVYDELKIAQEQASSKKERYSPLETMICAFGKDIKNLLPKPTSDVAEIKKAIDKIENDESGVENTFGSISKVIDQYAGQAARSDRKLAVVLMTDEVGDDAQMLEDVIAKSDRFKVPVYFMAREATFGYPYARIRWIDPEPPNLHHWIDVRRGPETAFPECLQYNGFHGRHDSTSSGFGPYPQVRLAKKSGGIFFLLSQEEKNLVGAGARAQRKYDHLAMKEYEPLLLPEREYVQERSKSQFRSTIWDVIVALNPHLDGQLNIKRWHYPIDPEGFDRDGKAQFERLGRSMLKLNEGIKRLEQIRPLRDKEREPRWRASYDLALAQLYSYRVRQFQLMLALDNHSANDPKPKDPKANEWRFDHVGKMLEPTERQIAATKIDMKEIEAQKQKATDLFKEVIKEHPGTPWANRAQQEQGWGYGVAFHDYFWDPKYSDPKYQARVPKF